MANGIIEGTTGNDIIDEMYSDNDGDSHINATVVEALAGNDNINGTNMQGPAGSDGFTLDGGAGNDRVFDTERDDILYGGSGDDDLSANFATDQLWGGDGRDHLWANDNPGLNSSAALYGGEADDFLFSDKQSGIVTLSGGAGIDRFTLDLSTATTYYFEGYEAGEIIELGEEGRDSDGSHSVSSVTVDQAAASTIVELEQFGNISTLHFDTALSGPSIAYEQYGFFNTTNDPFATNYTGGDPNDLVSATGDLLSFSVSASTVPVAPNGVVDGTSGNDTVTEAYVDDAFEDIAATSGRVSLHSGDDLLQSSLGGIWFNQPIHAEGGDGSDEIWASGGDDTLFGGAGNDNLNHAQGEDHIYGGSGDDFIAPTSFTVLLSQSGSDIDTTAYGGQGNDRFDGWSGRFFGDEGNDIMRGASHFVSRPVALFGGSGDDTLYAFSDGSADALLAGGSGNDYFAVAPVAGGTYGINGLETGERIDLGAMGISINSQSLAGGIYTQSVDLIDSANNVFTIDFGTGVINPTITTGTSSNPYSMQGQQVNFLQFQSAQPTLGHSLEQVQPAFQFLEIHGGDLLDDYVWYENATYINAPDPVSEALSGEGATLSSVGSDNGGLNAEYDAELQQVMLTPSETWEAVEDTTLSYLVTYDEGEQEVFTQEVSVAPVNLAPLIVDETPSFEPGTSTEINFFDFLADVEGEEISILDVSASEGTIEYEGDGVAIYTPGEAEADSISFVAEDESGNQAELTLDVDLGSDSEPAEVQAEDEDDGFGGLGVVLLLGLAGGVAYAMSAGGFGGF